MHVLVTGGSGVVGKPTVDCLLERGHTVRLLSRNAERDCEQWATGVESCPASIGSDAEVRGKADGCDAVLHIAGVLADTPPDLTLENINIEGTRRMVEEAERAGVRRFVYVSSLGADTGTAEYHRSKRAAEEIVREFGGDWLICRPGNVYGPGDQVISLLLKAVRSLPAVPVIGGGDQPFQPVWAGDLGQALALATERGAPTREILDLAGPEQTTLDELLDLFGELTGKEPVRVPVPEWLAAAGTEAASLLGIELPVVPDQITMLLERNVIPPERTNALVEVFGVRPLPLREGLRKLLDSLPERLPSEGTGGLRRSRYWADIRGSKLDADALFRLICEEFYTLPPEGLLQVGVEPGSRTALREGETLTLEIPLRGTIQVRVEEIAQRTATAVTLEGHPLSGFIRFIVEEVEPDESTGEPRRDRDERSAEPGEQLLRFEIRSYTRASHLIDRLAMETVGEPVRTVTWKVVVEEVVRRSGGEPVGGIRAETETLDEEAARDVIEWAEALVAKRKRQAGPHPEA